MEKRTATLLLSGLILIFTTQAVSAQDRAQGKKLYSMYCASCHGDSGRGDGPASKSLPVKPANHEDRSVMSQLSDKALLEIISNGGNATGKSAFMPAWGGQLKEQEIMDLISFVRSLAEAPAKP